MKYKIILPAIALFATGLLLFGAAPANAQSPGEEITSLVQMIAQKFGLKTAAVQAVFDQHKKDRQATMEKNYETKLEAIEQSGKITEAQEQLILSKHKELVSQREANKDKFKNMTAEQRKATFEAEKKSLQDWAKQNNIDLKYLMGFGPGVFGIEGHGPGGFHKFGKW